MRRFQKQGYLERAHRSDTLEMETSLEQYYDDASRFANCQASPTAIPKFIDVVNAMHPNTNLNESFECMPLLLLFFLIKHDPSFVSNRVADVSIVVRHPHMVFNLEKLFHSME